MNIHTYLTVHSHWLLMMVSARALKIHQKIYWSILSNCNVIAFSARCQYLSFCHFIKTSTIAAVSFENSAYSGYNFEKLPTVKEIKKKVLEINSSKIPKSLINNYRHVSIGCNRQKWNVPNLIPNEENDEKADVERSFVSWQRPRWNVLICHRCLPGLMTTHMNLLMLLHAALPLRVGPFCVPAARIRFNVTRDRRGISECKLPHCSTVGPASPSDWLPAVELMVEGWNGERRLGNLIINVLLFIYFFLKSLSAPFSRSLSLCHSHFPPPPISLCHSPGLLNKWWNSIWLCNHSSILFPFLFLGLCYCLSFLSLPLNNGWDCRVFPAVVCPVISLTSVVCPCLLPAHF